MVEISLIPKKQESSNIQIKNTLYYAPGVVVATVLVVVYVVFLFQKISLEKSIDQSQAKFSQNDAIVKQSFGVNSYGLADRINNLSQILSSRLYWSNFLGRSDKIFNSDVTVKSTRFDMENFKIVVSGTTPTYDSLQKQLNSLKDNKDFVQSFSLAESHFSDNSISFTIEVDFKKDILSKKL